MVCFSPRVLGVCWRVFVLLKCCSSAEDFGCSNLIWQHLDLNIAVLVEFESLDNQLAAAGPRCCRPIPGKAPGSRGVVALWKLLRERIGSASPDSTNGFSEFPTPHMVGQQALRPDSTTEFWAVLTDAFALRTVHDL